MPSHRVEGVATLMSSLSHGGEHAGTTGFLRREKIVQADGTVATVPVVSGNSLRGILRDHSAELTWQMLGRPELPLPVFHALWSGGTLAKAGKGGVLGSRDLRDLRRLCPHVALFGCAGGGRIIEGSLQVGKLVPVCTETAHLMPPEALPEHVQSIWGMLQVEEFTRRDDAKQAGLQERIAGQLEAPDGVAGSSTPSAEQGTLLVEDPPAEVEPSKDDGPGPQQMRYGVETLAAGTRLHWWMAVSGPDLVVAQMRAALVSWARSGAHLGGRSGTGHGRVQLDIAQWVTTSHGLTAGSELAAVDADELTAHHEEHRAEIVEALAGLG